MPVALRGLCAVAALAGGVVVAVAAVAVHNTPVGLPLALLAAAFSAYALPGGWWARLPFVLGWVGVVGTAMNQRGEGDYLIAATWRGYALLGFTLVLLVAGIVTVRPPRSAPQPGPDDAQPPRS